MTSRSEIRQKSEVKRGSLLSQLPRTRQPVGALARGKAPLRPDLSKSLQAAPPPGHPQAAEAPAPLRRRPRPGTLPSSRSPAAHHGAARSSRSAGPLFSSRAAKTATSPSNGLQDSKSPLPAATRKRASAPPPRGGTRGGAPPAGPPDCVRVPSGSFVRLLVLVHSKVGRRVGVSALWLPRGPYCF